MKPIARRSFLKQAGAAAAGATTAAWGVPALGATGANDRVTVGVIGCSRGTRDADQLAKSGAKIAYVCDPDDARANRAKQQTKADRAVADMRRILDDKAVDAVVIAAPDHWHAPAAILACQAGKHVYVEKPCCHNIREGRLMIKAARRTKRVMQVGSQSRSTTKLMEAIQMIREGAIGDVLVAKAWNSQRRANIGHKKPSPPPAGFDYDLWVGPAPMRPYQANCHHYTWHWWYDFGTGDAGNDGVHEIDIALWGLDINTHPVRASGQGAKLHFDDDQQFPDTQYVTFEYADDGKRKRPIVVYEQRIWSPYVLEGLEDGGAFYGTKGYLLIGKRVGWKLYGEGNKLVKEEKCMYSDLQHAQNFLDAIRTGKRPNADIEIGHRSATLVHLSNILARTGCGALAFDPKTEQIVGNDQANALTKRTYRQGHWAALKDT
ncbi:MAG: Gfo/Idh/MocA family oxidoreductase [Phycisphaerae bacterium]|nr:Gfo/Idh/MocA family oxidoreductase [Phycisphaerae bacterium]